jgi:radical SAM-linked protein
MSDAAATGPRQRWRLYLRIPASAVPGEIAAGPRAWTEALERAGLPAAQAPGSGRARASAAAPLPLGIAGEREIVDVFLAARLPVSEVRSRLEAALPPGVSLVDLHDVWLGAPAAPAAVVAADYRVEAAGAAGSAIRVAVARLIEATSLPRERRREKRVTEYDLRPLVVRLAVTGWDDSAAAGPCGTLEMRLRHTVDAVGRPEEVMAALADAGASCRVVAIVRERLVIAEAAPDRRGDGTRGA